MPTAPRRRGRRQVDINLPSTLSDYLLAADTPSRPVSNVSEVAAAVEVKSAQTTHQDAADAFSPWGPTEPAAAGSGFDDSFGDSFGVSGYDHVRV